MKHLWKLLLLLQAGFLTAQNSINYYNLAQEPMAIMENPAYDLRVKRHISVPFIGSNNLQFVSSGFTLSSLFADNAIPFTDKIHSVVYGLDKKDFIMTNQKMGLFQMGQRLPNAAYLSYGLYEEWDLYATFPVEFLKIPFEGIAIPDKTYHLDGFNTEASLMMTYHVGVSTKIDKQLRVGGRLKFYNAAMNLSATNWQANYTTHISDNQMEHAFTGIDVKLLTVGMPVKLDESHRPIKDSDGKYILLAENGDEIYFDTYAKKGYWIGQLILGGTKGLGVDLGFTYKMNRNMDFAASITDFGVLFYNRKVQKYHLKGDYISEGIALPDNPNDPTHYTDNLLNGFFDEVPLEVNKNPAIRLRPFQVNAFLTYTFNKGRSNSCNYLVRRNYTYKNKIGALLHAQKRPGQLLYDASVFYQKNIANILQARASYTFSRYNRWNFGLGLSTHVWKVDLFTGINNILGFANLAKANNASFQLGLNVLLDDDF